MALKSIYYKIFPDIFGIFLPHTKHSRILHKFARKPIHYSICVLNFMRPAPRTNFAESLTRHISCFAEPAEWLSYVPSKIFYVTSANSNHIFILRVPDQPVINNFNKISYNKIN